MSKVRTTPARMTPARPNLFSYATKELSQDAFICWSLEWAKSENAKADSKLHAYGVALIKALFKQADRKTPKEIKTIGGLHPLVQHFLFMLLIAYYHTPRLGFYIPVFFWVGY